MVSEGGVGWVMRRQEELSWPNRDSICVQCGTQRDQEIGSP